MDIKSVQREWEQILNASAPELVESDCEMDLGPDPNLLCLGLEPKINIYTNIYYYTLTGLDWTGLDSISLNGI